MGDGGKGSTRRQGADDAAYRKGFERIFEGVPEASEAGDGGLPGDGPPKLGPPPGDKRRLVPVRKGDDHDGDSR